MDYDYNRKWDMNAQVCSKFAYLEIAREIAKEREKEREREKEQPLPEDPI